MPKSRELFLDLARSLLRPVVRFCLRRGVLARDFLSLTKQLYVEEGAQSLSREGTEVTVSRVSVITGLSRREVTSFLGEELPATGEHIIHKVLGSWQSHPHYHQGRGTPKALTCVGSESEFAKLVRSVSKDINPYTLLFELERSGLIKRVADTVTLCSPVYVPSGQAKKGFQMAARDMDDLIQSVEQNIFEDPSPLNLHIKTHYDNIIPSALPKIRAWFMHKGEKLHEEARGFLSKFDRDLNPKLSPEEGSARVALGAFSLVEGPSSKEKSAPSKKRAKKGGS